jgi:hypothetical protein
MGRQLAHAFGLLLGYAGLSIALRLADAIAHPLTAEETPA